MSDHDNEKLSNSDLTGLAVLIGLAGAAVGWGANKIKEAKRRKAAMKAALKENNGEGEDE